MNNLPVLWAAVFLWMVADAVFAGNKDHGCGASAACVDAVVARSTCYVKPSVGAHQLCRRLFHHLDTVWVEFRGRGVGIETHVNFYATAIFFGDGLEGLGA